MQNIPEKMIEHLEAGEEIGLVCVRVDEGSAKVNSMVENCSKCGASIFLSEAGEHMRDTYPNLVTLVCTTCAIELGKDTPFEGAIGAKDILLKMGVPDEIADEILEKATVGRPVAQLLEEMGYSSSRDN